MKSSETIRNLNLEITKMVSELFYAARQLPQFLIIISTFVSITVLFLTGEIRTGTAPVAEFLFITCGTDTSLTGVTVIGWSAGEREFAVCILGF